LLKVTPYLELDQEAKQLVDRISDTTINLTFSESAVLSHLLCSTESICDKESLLEKGWPDRVVAITSLTQCISTLRKKLEPYPEVQLKTIARRGYQLHISTKSHIKMLAVNDAESIRSALFHVSLMVKIVGVLIVLGIIAYYWYGSDHHSVLQESKKWSSDKQISLNLGGTFGTAQLIYANDVNSLNSSMWQKHIAPESNQLQSFDNFIAFAFTDGHTYSFACCVNDEQGACPADQLINITSIGLKPAGLNMVKFMQTRKLMEGRIRYNRILIPENEVFNKPAYTFNGAIPDLIEHHYYGDIYFPVADELLIRADLSVSLVYEGDDHGKLYSSTCITDEDCLTTPIKYQVRGNFKQYRMNIDDVEMDVFQVKVTQKQLLTPQTVSPSAMYFYRQIRKHDILDEDLYFYRVYSDAGSAVWIVPVLGNIIAWTKYERVEL